MTERREPTMEEKRLILTAHTILHSLEEFRFGYDRLSEAEKTDDYGSVRIRYNVTALMHYLAGGFLLANDQSPRGGFIETSLNGFGVDAEIESVYRALQAPVGTSTVGEVVRLGRNRVSVHPKTLVPDELIAQAEDRHGAEHEALSNEFPIRFHDVCAAVLALEIAIRQRLPRPLWPPDSRDLD